MTTDYELHQMFDILNKVQRRNANFGNTPAQRSRANEGETARFEASNPSSVGTRAGKSPTGLGESGQVPKPAKAKKIVQPKKPAKPKPAKPVKPKEDKTVADTIDGKVKPTKQKRPKTKKTPKPKAKPMSRREREVSQIGADPTSRGARAAYSGSRARLDAENAKQNEARRKRARAQSKRAKPEQTYAARKIQNRLGVRGVAKPVKPKAKKSKVKKEKKKSIGCPLVKAELNGAFNNLLDQYQVLYD